ncbi:MAG: hypothetical protein ACR2L1_10520 [Pyrinomonadaceae bacterium]
MPVLQELVAVGGSEGVRFLYSRLLNYFPQINENETALIKQNSLASWRKLVQRAGRDLNEKKLLHREKGIWTISEKGIREVEAQKPEFEFSSNQTQDVTHNEIQDMLVEIGKCLNFYAEVEFEYYDVVWRENERSLRLSHVFEVQSKGNIDSAFAKLKRAYSAQRSKIFLVLTSERDTNRARKSLEREFQELENILVILSFSQIKLVFQNLKNIAEIMREFLIK